MECITDKMINDFYGEYERPKRLRDIIDGDFFEDVVDDFKEEDDGSFCI